MPRISRTLYSNAAQKLLEAIPSTCTKIEICKFIVVLNARILFVDIAGKNLPYYGSDGKVGFAWETHINPKRIDRIIYESSVRKSLPYLGFCYLILDKKYRTDFSNTYSLANSTFGLKLISVDDFKAKMQSRSAHSWGEVELPRADVLNLLKDPEKVP